MSGLYLHIPFCKQACYYCNFHFSTSLRYKEKMIDAIVQEIQFRHAYLLKAPLTSIYFGGGTPSLLDENDLDKIFKKIHQHFSITSDAEITLEANPDDISIENLKIWKKIGINRLSIGVQSFANEDLLYMNRAHNATEAKVCIQMAQDAGFYNLTVDLIYGSPTTSDETWQENVNTLFDLKIPHLSCYALTVEPKTALAYKIRSQKSAPVEEEQSARQYELLMDWMKADNYIHYETSNFAKEGFFAKHNSAYWQGVHYLGLGPSAHSYDGVSRQWNIANNAKYMETIENITGKNAQIDLLFEKEVLSEQNQYNELVLTGLRTIWGVDSSRIPTKYRKQFQKNIQQFVNTKHVFIFKTKYILSDKGRLISDFISSELFI